MKETTAGKLICPVCSEELDASAPKCFRCTTELSTWWPLEKTLRNRVEVSEARAVTGRTPYSRVVTILALGALLGFAGAHLSLRRGAQSSSEESPVAVKALSASPVDERATAERKSEAGRPLFVLYTIQPGDSLWRVAASLTGDGRNWRRLWPEFDGQEKKLQRGTNLEVPITALQGVAPGSGSEEG